MGHLRTLKESKWTFFYLKTCLLSIKAANWGTGSLQLLCSRFIIKHLLSFWTTWEPWLILLQESCSSIKLTQRNCLLLLDKSPHSDLQAMTIQTSQAWSWRIFLASNDGTLPGARRSSTRHHPRPWGQGESLPHPPRAPLTGQRGQPLLVQTYDLVQDAKVSTPVTVHMKGLTPPLWWNCTWASQQLQKRSF